MNTINKIENNKPMMRLNTIFSYRAVINYLNILIILTLCGSNLSCEKGFHSLPGDRYLCETNRVGCTDYNENTQFCMNCDNKSGYINQIDDNYGDYCILIEEAYHGYVMKFLIISLSSVFVSLVLYIFCKILVYPWIRRIYMEGFGTLSKSDMGSNNLVKKKVREPVYALDDSITHQINPEVIFFKKHLKIILGSRR